MLITAAPCTFCMRIVTNIKLITAISPVDVLILHNLFNFIQKLSKQECAKICMSRNV